MLSFLGPKGFRAEVTEGIDLETSVMLTGTRVTIGSGPGDTLQLGAADIVPGHVTFEKRSDGRGWDYFTSDRGFSQIDKGNPRTGPVRAGMWLRLGQETRLDISAAAAPAEASTETGKEAEPTTVPMPVAVGLLGAIGVVALMVTGALGGGEGPRYALQTTPWVTGGADLNAALSTCLEQTVPLDRAVSTRDPAHAFWRVMALRSSDISQVSEAEGALAAEIREILTSAHLLSRENNDLGASEILRRIQYVLPVPPKNCPILSATEYDLALLEVRGNR